MNTTQPRSIRTVALVIAIAMALSACGRIGTSDPITVTWEAVGSDASDNTEAATISVAATPDETSTDIVFEPAGQPGQDPFSPVMLLTTEAPRPPSDEDPENEGIGNTEDTEVATGLYGGSGTVAFCNVEALVDFLEDEDNSDKALAWADALDIEVADIGEYISTLEVAVLTGPTRVTNNGYRNGHASPFQATLATSTAVLVDETGAPRVRCACGNPLGDPRDPIEVPDPQPEPDPAPTATPTPTPDVPPTQTDPDPVDDVEVTQPDPGVLDFCATWDTFGPIVLGGPAGPDDVAGYLDRLVEVITALIEAAEQDPDFSESFLEGLVNYLTIVTDAAENGGDALGMGRLLSFVGNYCDPTEDGTLPDDPTDRDPKVNDFCDTWAALAPSMLGGPNGDIDAYLDQLVAAFTALIAAAEQEAGFPESAMDDFVAYLEDLVYAADTGDLTGGDTALGSRVEGFLSRYCGVLVGDDVDQTRGSDLTHVEGS